MPSSGRPPARPAGQRHRYFYESRLCGEAIHPAPALNGGYNDVHLHPAEPVSFRVALSGTF